MKRYFLYAFSLMFIISVNTNLEAGADADSIPQYEQPEGAVNPNSIPRHKQEGGVRELNEALRRQALSDRLGSRSAY